MQRTYLQCMLQKLNSQTFHGGREVLLTKEVLLLSINQEDCLNPLEFSFQSGETLPSDFKRYHHYYRKGGRKETLPRELWWDKEPSFILT